MNKDIEFEISAITGSIFRGDITPLVYDLLKDSKDLPAIIKLLSSDAATDMGYTKTQETSECPTAPKFDEWFKEFAVISQER